MSNRNQTNVEFVTELMEFSQAGPMMQLFVIEAIATYAKAVAEAGVQEDAGAFVSPEAWHRTAVLADKAITEKYRA